MTKDEREKQQDEESPRAESETGGRSPLQTRKLSLKLNKSDESLPSPPQVWESPYWGNDSFLAALQSGFDRDVGPSSIEGSPRRGRSDSIEGSPRPLRRRSIDFSGLKEVREEKADYNSEPEPSDPSSHAPSTVDENRDVETGKIEVVDHDAAQAEETKNKKKWWPSFEADKTAVRFGIRISTVLTLSSLFVLVQPPDDVVYPAGVWVYISALMVSWFPSLAAASVVEKTFQRILGTCIGAVLGIACGFLSLTMPNWTGQAVFIGVCIALVSFFYSFATLQFKASMFGKYSYASLLCLLTFGIAILPFYSDDDPKHKKGVFRVVNVIVGCAIGGLGALFLWPRSTKTIMREKIQKQVKLAGEASDAVLQFAARTFSRHTSERNSMMIVTAAQRSFRRSIGMGGLEEGGDDLDFAAHDKYNKALADWKRVDSVFPLAKWDPFNLFYGAPEENSRYREQVALTLARALRIQTTVVILDGLIRNDRDSMFSQLQIELFLDIGAHIKVMLTPPYNEEKSEAAAEILLDRLDDVRGYVIQDASDVAGAAKMHRRLFSGSMGKEDYKARLKDHDVRFPLLIRSHDSVSLLFLQLVEHLVVRSLRLYYIWRQVEQ